MSHCPRLDERHSGGRKYHMNFFDAQKKPAAFSAALWVFVSPDTRTQAPQTSKRKPARSTTALIAAFSASP